MSTISVPSLFDIAAASAVCNSILDKIDAVFKEFEKSQEIESPENPNVSETDPPPQKKIKMDPTLMSKLKDKRDAELRKIRKEIDENLHGLDCTVREDIVATFLGGQASLDQTMPKKILAFLDCLLSRTFTTLDLTAFKNLDPVETITTISQHCPNLQVLSLSFGTNENPVPFVLTISKLLKELKRLTRLSLVWIHQNDKKNNFKVFEYFFSRLGSDLPNLTSLEIGGTIPFRTQELFQLMFGPKERLISLKVKQPMWSKKNYGLSNISFRPECLTPLCHSLTELKVNFTNCKQRRHETLLAFVLRNFRNLKNFSQNPKLLCKAMLLLRERQLQSSDTFIPERGSFHTELGTVQWTEDAPFVGPLLLDTIQVSIVSRSMMHLVHVMCPDLKHVHFVGDRLEHGDELSSEDVRVLISQPANSPVNCWTQVKSIEMTNVNHLYRRVVLEVLGGGENLKKLTLVQCNNVHPGLELLPCTKLQMLAIKQGSFVPVPDLEDFVLPLPDAVIDDLPNKFLSHLANLDIRDTCPVQWSKVFECHRPSLTGLSVSCLHIGTEIGLNGWDQVNILWPNLRQLIFYEYGTATLNMIRSIAPYLWQFQHLKELRLPNKSAMDALIKSGISLPPGLRVKTSGGSFVQTSGTCRFII